MQYGKCKKSKNQANLDCQYIKKITASCLDCLLYFFNILGMIVIIEEKISYFL